MNAFSIIPLTIEARGEIITNNLPHVRDMVREGLSRINRDLLTDEDFGQAELDVKALKEVEDVLRTAAVKAFDDQLKALVDGLNETAEEIRVPRLELEKIIAARKEAVKSEIVEEFITAFDIEPRLARKHFLVGLQTQLKGKRTLQSMRSACRVYQLTQQAMIDKCREILTRFETAHGADMISDRRELELEKPEGLEAELRRRFEAKRAREEKSKMEAELSLAKAEAARASAEANKQAFDPRNPHNLPPPPKIGGIPTGSKAAAPESNVLPFALEPTPETITEDDEWKQVEATVFAAFAAIKEHRERLIHTRNLNRLLAFGPLVNDAWKEIKNIGAEVLQ